MYLTQEILLTIIASSTPFLIAAIGELVTERSGVLNLGVEGMMIMGAVIGFAAGYLTDNAFVGVIAAILAGMALASLFAFMTLVLAANQVASGLALTILGLGFSELIGTGFVGQKREAIARLNIPGLSDLPFIGPVLFGQNALVYVSVLSVAAV